MGPCGIVYKCCLDIVITVIIFSFASDIGVLKKLCCFWNFDNSTKKNNASKKIIGYFDRTSLAFEIWSDGYGICLTSTVYVYTSTEFDYYINDSKKIKFG